MGGKVDSTLERINQNNTPGSLKGELCGKSVDQNARTTSRKWSLIAIIVTGLALAIPSFGLGARYGVKAYQGTTSFMQNTFITFSLKPLLSSVGALALGIFGLISSCWAFKTL